MKMKWSGGGPIGALSDVQPLVHSSADPLGSFLKAADRSCSNLNCSSGSEPLMQKQADWTDGEFG